jgi:ribonuclease BN (tRNA processing enzyme)
MLKFLGRGSAFNVKEGNTSAYFLNDNTLFLIDCGENIFERILKNHILNDIKRVEVFVTHLNSDHVGSLSSLIYYCYYVKKIPININYPNDELKQLLFLMGHRNEYLYRISNDLEYDNDICISYVETTHIKTMKCYSLMMLYSKKTIYYSGDSNKLPHTLKSNFDNFDIIYQDVCMADYDGNVHMSLRELCENIPIQYRNKVYCMHIDSDILIEKAKVNGFNVVECK